MPAVAVALLLQAASAKGALPSFRPFKLLVGLGAGRPLTVLTCLGAYALAPIKILPSVPHVDVRSLLGPQNNC